MYDHLGTLGIRVIYHAWLSLSKIAKLAGCNSPVGFHNTWLYSAPANLQGMYTVLPV